MGHGHHGHGGHKHGHHGHRDPLGNPEDLAAYLERLEGPDRAGWQKPGAVLDALGLGPTDVIAEIGAGPGYFTLPLAERVAHVFAVEAEIRILEVLGQRIRGRHNITPVLGSGDDPRLPRACCDLALVVDTYHHFEGGPRYLEKLAGLLRPGGRIVNIDFHAGELPVGPGPDHKVSRGDFLKDAQAAGLELIREHTFLPYQYFVELAPRSRER